MLMLLLLPSLLKYSEYVLSFEIWVVLMAC